MSHSVPDVATPTVSPQHEPPLPGKLLSLLPFVLGAGMACGCFFIYEGIAHALRDYLLDVGVFRDAGRAYLDGYPLYSAEFPTRSGFRFIYPPFAALLFAPLAVMNETVMELVWTAATFMAVFGVIAMAVDRSGLAREYARRVASEKRTGVKALPGHWWAWALGLTGVAIALEPLRAHVMYGQINIFLVLLVTADVLGYTPRKIRGIGVGIAAGIKITPAAYALIFLVRKDVLSVARSAGFFLLTALIGWLARAEDSLYFWTEEFFNPDRGGAPPYPPNQALTGLISRLGVSDDTAHSIMGPGFLGIAVLAGWAAWKYERAERPVDALLTVVLAIVLAAPLAVTHHWAGVVIMLVLLFRPLNKAMAWALGVSIVAHLIGLHSVYPEKMQSYSFMFPEYFIGNAQGLSGLALFVVLLATAHKVRAHTAAPRE